MLAIAAEAALDSVLWDMLRSREGLPPEEYNLLLHEHNTRGQRLKLFEERTGTTVEAALANNRRVPRFMADWNAVVDLRNHVAHGRCTEYREDNYWTEKDLLPAARRFQKQFFTGFAELNNFVYEDQKRRP